MTNPETQICPKCGAEVPDSAPNQPCPACLMKMGLDSSMDSADSPAFAATTPQAGGFVPLQAAAIAEHFPHLEIMELLGQGGMGAVYKARQTKLDRLVALKIIRPESAEDPAFAERFNREARTLARLNHPGIVGVHDFGEIEINAGSLPSGGTLFFFIMEYVDGLNLRQLMESQELVSDQTLTIIPQICEGLQFAHDEGVVHRDIKPENILIDSRGNVKIADFGLAKLAEQSADNFTLTGTHQVMGTPRYMAPEQMGGSRGVDHRADIYSLGVVFYELLTGEVPMGQFEPPSKKTAVDARLDDVVLRALASEPERRFQSAGELKSRVNAISSVNAGSTAGTQSEMPPMPRPGVSTIMEREAVAAWHWVAGEADSTQQDSRPELPALLMVLLSIAGCLSVVLPWIDVEIVKPKAPPVMGSTMDMAEVQTGGYLPCLMQDAGFALPVGNSGSINEHHHTFNGLDKWPGLTVCGTFALLTLLLIALPAKHRRMVRWSLLMTLLAGLALLHTFLFKLEVDLSSVHVPPGQMRLSDATGQDARRTVSGEIAAAFRQPERHFVMFQEAYAQDSLPRLEEVDHRLTYRAGFYCALSMSITMLVLSATGIRHAVAHRDGDSLQPKHPGLPLGHVHFSAPQSPDIRERIKSHFFGLGYQLAQEDSKKWVFHRGRRLAGLTSTDIKAFDTTLTVRANAGAMGVVWVNCRWNVHTMGAMISDGSIAVLEAEGHSLDSSLNSDEVDVAPVTENRSEHSSNANDSDRGIGAGIAASPVPPPQNHTADNLTDSWQQKANELDEMQSVVEGPATAVMAVGMLLAIGSLIGLIVCMNSSLDEETTLLCVPGMIIGPLMAFGGWQMRRLRSLGLSMVGAIFGLIPFNPGALLCIPLSIWAIRVLNQPDVRNAFIVRARQRKLDAERSVESRFSRKAIFAACLIPVFFFFVPLTLVPVWALRSETSVGTPPLFAILMIGMPALLAPFLTTILGFMAVSDIRHSNGQLTGLGLALVDAAFFPFLLLNVLICGACWFGLEHAGAPEATREMLVLIVACLLALWNALAGWWLWKKLQIR